MTSYKSDAHCPKCGKLADYVNPYGWLFHCGSCSGSQWGHPQLMSRAYANELLHDAKKAEEVIRGDSGTWDAPLYRLMQERLREIDRELGNAPLEHHELMSYIGEVDMLLRIDHEITQAIDTAGR
jgi:hypothetical protein